MIERYEEYQDSGVEWIGEIPVGWEAKQIKRISIVRRGASPRPIADPKYFDTDGEWAWVRIADVSASERYLKSTTQTLSQLGSSLSVKIEPNSIFLSIAGTVGKPIITKIRCCIHDGFVYFPNLKINPEYLYYIFATGLPYRGLGKWGTQLNLNTDTVGKIFIPIPRKEEIKAIVHYLDCKTAEIDALIKQKERLLELYEEEKTVIINHAVTKGIEPNAELKDSGIEWIGEIPVGWELKKLSYCFDSIGSGTTPTSGEADYYFNGSINWLQTGDLNDGEIVSTSKKITKKAVDDYSTLRVYPTGSLIIAMYGATIGKVGLLKISSTTNQACCVLSEPNSVVPKFAFYWLVSIRNHIISLAYGGGQPNINQEMIRSLKIQLPSADEQTAIANFLDRKTAKIDALIAKIQRIIELQREYRTVLISDVVTGKIKVPRLADEEIEQ